MCCHYSCLVAVQYIDAIITSRMVDPSNNILSTMNQSDVTAELHRLREEVTRLKRQIRSLEAEGHSEERRPIPTTTSTPPLLAPVHSLTPDQISRYSRHLLLADGFGIQGQARLLSVSILVVGAGGIGSSLLLYLAAAGLGHITVVDFDDVERSNLGRQIVHRDVDAANGYTGHQAGKNKAQSAKEAMIALNPTVSVTALNMLMNASNVMGLVQSHTLVVDASDNPATRYLLNDACVLSHKILVSGSAMGTEGQLTVYNYRPMGDYVNKNDNKNDDATNNTQAASTGNNHIDNKSDNNPQCKRTACYRCLYPNPNPTEGCKSCSDNGVLGPVPGLIGVLQAMEVIKIVTGIG